MFAAMVGSLVRQQGCSKRTFAHSVGLTPSALSRILTGTAQSSQPSTDLCLRIAHVCGVDASVVLHAAGKRETAVLIELLYGSGRPSRERPPLVTRAELVVLDDWRRLTRPARRALALLLSRSTPQKRRRAG